MFTKKSVSVVCFTVAALTFIASNVFAQSFGFLDLYTVNSSSSTAAQDTFDYSQTPYLYMKLEIPSGAIANTISAWNAPLGSAYFGSSSLSNDVERWVSLANWNTVKEPGAWTVYANYFDSRANNVVGAANFTVTPEPATITLFLLGGLPLFYRKLRKENKIKTLK